MTDSSVGTKEQRFASGSEHRVTPGGEAGVVSTLREEFVHNAESNIFQRFVIRS